MYNTRIIAFSFSLVSQIFHCQKNSQDRLIKKVSDETSVLVIMES